MFFGIASRIKLYIAHYKRINRLFEGFHSKCPIGCSGNKSAIEKISDYLYIFLRMKIMPENYHLFGFDSKKRSEFKRYIGEPWTEPFVRPNFGRLWNNGIILRDKQLFKIICDYHGLPVPRHYGMLAYGRLETGKENAQELIKRHQPKKLVLKPTLGQNGVGIQFFDPLKIEEICAAEGLRNEVYIIEEAIEQHPEMSRINPHSVNSVRLITFLCRDGKIEFLTGMLKTSSSKSPIDNFSLGGIAAGIDLETGKIKTPGFAKFYAPDAVIDNRKCTDPKTIQQILLDVKAMQSRHPSRSFQCHPLTGFQFEGFQIPLWDQILETATRAQKVFHHGKAVAFDIAVTANGPVILEGNEGWGTSGIQAVNGGLLTEKNRKLFSQYGIQFY